MIRVHSLAGRKQRLSGATTRRFWLALALCAVATVLTAAAFASSDKKSDKHRASEEARDREVECEVENFGKVTDFYYRGAQPEPEQYHQLAALGVRTVIDLRHDPKGFAKNKAELAGMKYLNLPMSDKEYPASDVAARFLQAVNDRENWPVFVHCAGGRHRTGAMTAVFRMTNQGWDINQAYSEMKDYDFYTRWGHKPIKEYVFDYYKELTRRRITHPVETSR
ncbi:MAG: tyrosine-protein phosphatase [Blastocatellia bacterium]|nr:tyrosine-protein phosphatase [Blastocatellia bacterium]